MFIPTPVVSTYLYSSPLCFMSFSLFTFSSPLRSLQFKFSSQAMIWSIQVQLCNRLPSFLNIVWFYIPPVVFSLGTGTSLPWFNLSVFSWPAHQYPFNLRFLYKQQFVTLMCDCVSILSFFLNTVCLWWCTSPGVQSICVPLLCASVSSPFSYQDILAIQFNVSFSPAHKAMKTTLKIITQGWEIS